MTFATFSWVGIFPVISDRLIICVIGFKMLTMDSFRTFVGISSCPKLVFGFNFFTMSRTCVELMGSRNMLFTFGLTLDLDLRLIIMLHLIMECRGQTCCHVSAWGDV